MEERAVSDALPPVWILAFCRECGNRWVHLLAPGRYKHVRAYAYVPAIKTWLFYDVTLANSVVMAIPDGPAAEQYIGDFTRDADLVSIKPVQRKGPRLSPFTCVSAVKHLIGLRSGALRPDRLYRDCLAAGGTAFARKLTPTAPIRGPAG